MIIVTGAAGFIGSAMVGKLNNKGIKKIVVVDNFTHPVKNKNLQNKIIEERVDRRDFFNWLESNYKNIGFIYHLGARTDTTEFNVEIFNQLNLNYSKTMWQMCSRYKIPLVYASSAATYGDGSLGYLDDHQLPYQLKPLNPYGDSKNDFDKWALQQDERPPYFAGMKFFNVYGPNEYHKGRMASVVFHAFNQIRNTGGVRLFRSHNPGYADGGQLRDFVYVKDVVDVLYYMMTNQPESGLYNLGTGQARTFLDLAKSVFRASNLNDNIEFMDTPEDIRDKYQYFTEARMEKLKSSGYLLPFYSLEEGIHEYVNDYLSESKYF